MRSLDPNTIERVLIVRLSAVGDIIHGLPVLRALKDWRPELQIDWLVEDRFASLLRNIREIDQVIKVPRKQWKTESGLSVKWSRGMRLRNLLVQRRIQASIDLQGLTKSGIWPWLAGIPHRIGYGDEDGREINRFMNNLKVQPENAKHHVVDRNLALLEPLGIKDPDVDLSIPEDPKAKERVEAIIEKEGWQDRPLALLQPGAGWPTKQWPPNYYAQVGDWLSREYNNQVVVLWGPGEEDLASSVVSNMQEDGLLAPATNLLELIELIRRCDLFVGGDTGPMHIAAAIPVPTAALFGASDPVRNGPYGQEHLVVFRDEVSCRPCWKTKCEHVDCLMDLSPETVIARIKDWKTQ